MKDIKKQIIKLSLTSGAPGWQLVLFYGFRNDKRENKSGGNGAWVDDECLLFDCL